MTIRVLVVVVVVMEIGILIVMIIVIRFQSSPHDSHAAERYLARV